MKYYAKLSDDGFVISIISSDVEQDGLVEIDQPIENAPDDWYMYHLESKQWIQKKPVEFVELDLKNKRNKLLYESDWTQLSNGPLTTEVQQQWATYRQALRDITAQSGYPFDVVWPISPNQA